MATRNLRTSPLVYARSAGVLYLILIIFAPFSMMYIPSTLTVPGDAMETANRIMASESLFRMGLMSDSIVFLTELPLVVLLYVLFRPVSRTIAMVAAFARLANAIVQGVNLLNNLVVLLLLGGAGYLAAFSADQVHALVLLFLDAHQAGVYIWQVFFGLHCLVIGYLLFVSGYYPRILGVLMAVAALGYLTDSFGNFLFPAHRETYALIVGVTAVMGEIPFFLWLLIKGVDAQQWHRRAAASA